MSNQITQNPSVPSQVVQEVKFQKFVNNLGIIPTSYKDSMSYYECLAWLCKYLEETVIPTVNENGEAVEELQELYVELNNYVTHYFDNLDVQEEINNKLDEMSIDGTLLNILSNYTNLLRIINTTSEMLLDETLLNGQKIKTLGYYSIHDGGGAEFIITNTVDSTKIQFECQNDLYATYYNNEKEINVNQYGLKMNDENYDNASLLTSLINLCNSIGYNIKFLSGFYNFDTSITISDRLQAMIIKGSGEYYADDTELNSGTLLIYTGVNTLFNFSNNLWKSKISDFTILCTNTNGGSGFHFSGILYQSYLENLTINKCKKGIVIEQYAYCFLNNITITNTDNEYIPEIGLQIGVNASSRTEYIFINNFILQFRNQLGTGILIYKALHISIKNADIVYCEKGLDIQANIQMNWIDFQFLDFARCKKAMIFDCTNYYITGGTISNVVINYREECTLEDDFGVQVIKSSTRTLQNLIFRNMNFRLLDSSKYANGVYDIASPNWSGCEFEISNSTANVKHSLGVNSYSTNPLTYYSRPLKWFYNSYNSANTSITYTLLTNSPFNYTPHVVVKDSKNKITNYSVSNTLGGDLSVTITISEATNNWYYIEIPVCTFTQISES